MKSANLFLSLITVCFLLTAGVTAQNTQPVKGLDSILRVIKNTSDPGKKVILINNAVKDYNDNSPVFDSLLQEAGRLCQTNNLIGLKWEVMATKGFILLARGDYQGAQNSYFEAAQVAVTNNDSTNYFILQGMIALVNYYLKSYEKAEQYYLQTIRFLEKSHNKKELASVYNNLGMVYSEQKRYRDAIGQYEKSYQLKMQLKDPDYLHVLNNLADANQRQGNLTIATELFRNFFKQSYLIRNPVYMAVANINLGSVLSEGNQPEKALPYLKESLTLCKSNGYKTYEFDALQELSKCYSLLGDFRNAYQTSLIAGELHDSLLNQERIASMQETEARYETRNKEEQIKSLQIQQSKDNKIINLQLAVIALALAGLLMFVFVIFQLRKRNHQRQIQNLALKELNDNKNRFFSIIAHDLRSPFSALLGLLDILLDQYEDLPPEKIRIYLNQLNLSANNTYSLLQNLLMWSNSQMEGVTIKLQQVRLNVIVNQQLDFLNTSVQEKNIQVESIICNDLVFRTDPEMLSVIIRNLLTNAIKYSHSFGKITITGTIDSHAAKLAITDNGVGISQEKLSDILKMGTGKSTPGTNGEKGTGLGLHLCKTFLEKLGGELQVESTPGEGTSIICIFPV